MEERTRAYLRGRFGDHYRRTTVPLPPGADAREWGFIPWTAEGTTMVRHRSLLDLGDPGEFLVDRRPRHVYFSAGRYENPGAGSMSAKGWYRADLVFDLDADHLPAVEPGHSYGEMLAACKDALYRLLDFLDDDFGFDDLAVVFSGGRGYHVHVRDEGIQELGREERREIVDYVRGHGLDVDGLIGKRPNETGTLQDTLRAEGGWGRRTHRALLALAEEVREADEAAALARLEGFEGIGEVRAEKLLRAFRTNLEAIEAGNMEAGTAKTLAKIIAREVVEAESAPIDEPVTTDINRLIRLPASLHGGSGLAVRPIARDELDAFDPLVDAVPETFVGHDITVEVPEGEPAEVPALYGGDRFTLQAGEHTVPEYAGVFLMARGRAEKGKE